MARPEAFVASARRRGPHLRAMSVLSVLFRVGLVATLLTLPLRAFLDRDRDGVSDIWTALHPTAVPPSADPDGDGSTNATEALAGTDPHSAASVFAVVPQRDGSGRLVVRWAGVLGKYYQVEASGDLRTWVALPERHPGAGGTIEVVVRTAGAPVAAREFWRVVVSDADADADADGLTDWEEAQLGTSSASSDTDADGLPDAWEAAYGLSPTVANGADDPDRDGFTNVQEHASGMNPSLAPSLAETTPVGLVVYSPHR